MDLLKSSKKLLENISGSSKPRLRIVSEPFGPSYKVWVLLYFREGVSHILLESGCDNRNIAEKLVKDLQEAFSSPEIQLLS